MSQNFVMELVMKFLNQIGPPAAEAAAQVAALDAEVAATTATAEGASVAAGGLAGLLTGAVVVGFATAAAGAVAFGAALKIAGDRLYDVGERAREMELAGGHLNVAQEKAAKFAQNMDEADEYMNSIADTLAYRMEPALMRLSQMKLFGAQVAAGVVNTDWGATILNGLRTGIPVAVPGSEAFMDPFNPGVQGGRYIHGDFTPTAGKAFRGYGGVESSDYIAGAGRGGIGWVSPGLRGGGEDPQKTLEALIKVEDWFKKVKEPVLQFTQAGLIYNDRIHAMERFTKSASISVSTSISQSVDAFVTGAQTAGQAFDSFIDGVTAKIVSAALQQGIGLALGAIGLGIGGPVGGFIGGIGHRLAGGGSAGQAGSTTININALNARTILQDVSSPAGEFYQATRDMRYAARLP